MTRLGLALYLAACGVGLAARYGGLRFGAWHHRLYALVVAATVAATMAEFHPALLLTLAALAALPRARPYTAYHPGLAWLGLVGYLGARLW